MKASSYTSGKKNLTNIPSNSAEDNITAALSIPPSPDINNNTFADIGIFTLTAATGQEVRFTYLPDQKKVAAYVVSRPELYGHDNDNKEMLKLIKSEDLPIELKTIKDPATFSSFLANAYAKVAHLDNGDIKLYVNQKGVGVGKQEDAALLSEARDGKAEEVQKLLAKGADAGVKDNSGRTLLHLAAANEKVGTVDLLLSQRTTYIDARDNKGDTALHRAAYNGHLKSVSF